MYMADLGFIISINTVLGDGEAWKAWHSSCLPGIH